MKHSLKSSSILELTTLACICMLLAAFVNEAYGQGRGNGNHPQPHAGEDNLLEASVNIGISIGEARELAQMTGLTGLQSLPPGIARKLGRGKPLPPGIARQNLPESMLSRLPQYDDHEWVRVGTDLVLVALGTAIVVSILDEVFN